MTPKSPRRGEMPMVSSTIPSAKYSGSPLMLAKRNTAIDGLSGSGRSTAPRPVCAPRGMARGTDSGRGVLEPHRLLRPRQAVWCFCSRSTPFTLAVALTFVRTLSGEHRIRGSRSMRFAGTHGFNLAGGRRVVQKKRTRSPDRKTAHAGPPDARQADGATTYGHLLAP